MNDSYLEAITLSKLPSPNGEKIWELLLRAEAEGEVRAMYAIASWQLHGSEFCQKDESAGVEKLLRLSNSNIAEAIFNIAFAYDTGNGVDQDSNKALKYYIMAALLGDAESCDQVSQIYKEGVIVEADDDIASAWEQRSKLPESQISPPYRVWLDRD